MNYGSLLGEEAYGQILTNSPEVVVLGQPFPDLGQELQGALFSPLNQASFFPLLGFTFHASQA